MPRDDLIRFRRGTAAEWSAANPILDSGEPGFELDTGKHKIGDGSSTWNDIVDYFEPGAGGGGGETNTSSNVGTGVGLAKAKVGVNLPFKSIVGGAGVDVTASGADEVLIALDADAATQAELDTQVALLVPLTQRGTANGVATLGADSKIPTTQLPALAINDTFPVASEAAMLALTAQRGDVAVRSDESNTYILAGDDPSDLGDWVLLPTPTGAVLSVDGATGVVVLASDAAAGTASKRTLGTTSTQAAAGNDARFADERTPVDSSVTNAKVHATAAIAKSKLAALAIVNADVDGAAAIAESKLALASDAAAGTASRRTLGTSGTQAAAGDHAHSYMLAWVLDGGGSAITTGTKQAWVSIPRTGTITKWRLFGDPSGSVVIDVWKDTYANFPPTDADRIAGTDKPTLTTAVKAESAALTGWTTAVAAGDVLMIEVESAATLTRCRLELTVA